jgi:hypothetical protein
MLGRQKQVLDAFVRVQDWLRRHAPAMAHPSVARRLGELGVVIAGAERAAARQSEGLRSKEDATQELKGAVRKLRRRHLKPISAIAQALGDELQVQQACRLPRRRVPVMVLLAVAGGVRDVAGRHAEWFIECGRPPEFASQLDDAIAEVRRMVRRRDRAMFLHVGATAALVQHLKKARQIVELLNCQVLSAFDGDEARLAEWRNARRVRLLGSAGRTDTAETVAESQQEVVPLKLVAAA